MENAVQIFNHAEFGSIRMLEIDGEPWFVGKDVAIALGYSNPRDALSKRVNEEDKGVANCDTPGGKQNIVIINESGFYSLVLSSKLPTAKEFKHWVTSEVLPTIRKTGAYSMKEVPQERPVQKYTATRPLTSDDYIDAGKTIAKCDNKRLPIVIDMFRKAGLDMDLLQTAMSEANSTDDGVSDEEFVALLNKFSLSELMGLLGMGKSTVWGYRTGRVKPYPKRRAFIIATLS